MEGSAKILNKRQMYTMLERGELGNTLPLYKSLMEWEKAHGVYPMPTYGIRSGVRGGPCRLNCPVDQVEETWDRFSGYLPCISPMISNVGNVSWIGDVWDSPTGLVCYGIEYPPHVHDWRELMRTPTEWAGLSAQLLLSRHLNPNSLSDLYALIEMFPGHVYEMSTLDRCYGTIKGRNTIIWEVRLY